MARLLMAGWESGDINQIGVVSSSLSMPVVVSSTPTARSGTYCFKAFPQHTLNNGFARVSILHVAGWV